MAHPRNPPGAIPSLLFKKAPVKSPKRAPKGVNMINKMGNPGKTTYSIEPTSMPTAQPKKKPLKGSKILIIGITYKKDINDVRESPGLEIIEHLIKKRTYSEWAGSFTVAENLSKDSFRGMFHQ